MASVSCRALTGSGLDGLSAVLETGIVDVNENLVEDWAVWCSRHSVKASPSLSLPLAREQPEAGTVERQRTYSRVTNPL